MLALAASIGLSMLFSFSIDIEKPLPLRPVIKCGLPSGVLIDPAASADTQDDILSFNPNLQKNDRSNHRDDHDHYHGQPDSPAFLLSRSLACLRCLIPRGPLCGPSCLLLLSGFLRLRHFLPFSLGECDARHNGGDHANKPNMAHPACVVADSEILLTIRFTRTRSLGVA